MKTLRIILTFAFFISCGNSLLGQTIKVNYPQVGDTVADYVFTDILNSAKKEISIKDYRGQWLILDFWARWCTGCINTFPKMNKLSQDFKERAGVLMVGVYREKPGQQSSERKLIHSVFEPKMRNQNLTFTAVFDQYAADVFDVGAVPSLLIIDPVGIIRAKTFSIDSLQLAALIAGKHPSFDYTRSFSNNEPIVDMKKYDYGKPLYVSGKETNGGIDSVFEGRSLLAITDERTPLFADEGWDAVTHNRTAQALGVPLSELFRLAYTGKREGSWYYRNGPPSSLNANIIPENGNKKLLTEPGSLEKRSLYSYSVSLPAVANVSVEQFRQCLLDDLQRYLGLTSTLETRMLDVFNLVVADPKKIRKLKTKGGKRSWKENVNNRVGFDALNISIAELLMGGQFHLGVYNKFGKEGDGYKPPIYDATDLDYNIDISFKADINDFVETSNELRRIGFDLIRVKREMQCIVVRDYVKREL